eukprot:5051070-Pleurochrysis_carterae.AAC.1
MIIAIIVAVSIVAFDAARASTDSIVAALLHSIATANACAQQVAQSAPLLSTRLLRRRARVKSSVLRVASMNAKKELYVPYSQLIFNSLCDRLFTNIGATCIAGDVCRATFTRFHSFALLPLPLINAVRNASQ